MLKLLGWLDKLFETEGDKDASALVNAEDRNKYYECIKDRDYSSHGFLETLSENPHGTARLHGSPDGTAERWCPLAHPSAKQSRMYFQAQYFVQYNEVVDGETKQMCHPFKHEKNAVAKYSEVNGKLFEKIASCIGNEYLDMPDIKGVFYFNAYSDPFSYTLNCKDMKEVQEMWATLTDIDFASLYQLKVGVLSE